MESQVIWIEYNQGKDLVVLLDRNDYKSDKELIKHIRNFMNNISKFYKLGKLINLNEFFNNYEGTYISLSGMRCIKYLSFEEYEACNKYDNCEECTDYKNSLIEDIDTKSIPKTNKRKTKSNETNNKI